MSPDEFEVLLCAWILLKRAHDAVARVGEVPPETPDLDRLAASSLESFLARSGLSDRQKDRIKHSLNKSKDYLDILSSRRLKASQGFVIEYTNYVILKGVGIGGEIARKYWDASMRLQDALRHKRLATKGLDIQGQELSKGQSALRDVESLIDGVEGDIRQMIFGARSES